MNNLMSLINIEEKQFGDDKEYAVDARLLWQKLQIASRFNDWIKNKLSQTKAIENIDFTSLTKNLVSGGKQTEYWISLNTAKHIALMEGTQPADELRQYFIDFEKQAKKALLSLKTEIDKLKKANEIPNYRKQYQELEAIRQAKHDSECTLKSILIKSSDYNSKNPQLRSHYAWLQETIHFMGTGLRALQLRMRIDATKKDCNVTTPHYNQDGTLSAKSVKTGNNFITKTETSHEKSFIDYVIHGLFYCIIQKQKEYTVKEFLDFTESCAKIALGKNLPVFSFIRDETTEQVELRAKQELAKYNNSPLCIECMKLWQTTLSKTELFENVDDPELIAKEEQLFQKSLPLLTTLSPA